MTRHPTAEIAYTTVASGFILTTASSFTAQAAVPFSGTLTAGSGILLQAMAPFHRQRHTTSGSSSFTKDSDTSQL